MSVSLKPREPQVPERTAALPPLCAGDHLDRATFHARYAATPDSFRAELIRGVVFVPSPTHCPHGFTHALAMMWLSVYYARTPGTKMFDNTSTELLEDNEFQPDAQLIVTPEAGGQGVAIGQLISGAPHLVVEVASSSVAYDLYEKFEVYQQAGVQEYVVIVVEDQPEVRWFTRQNDRFTPLSADADGLLRSRVFPGLWLSPTAMLQGDAATVLAALQQGFDSPEHAAFVAELAGRRDSGATPS
jgi:Uma2 family endonuclease